MTRHWRLCLPVLLWTVMAAADWSTFGGDPQRTGWARGETILNKDNVGSLVLKWKLHLDNAPKELTSLAAPIVADNVKTGRGIKEFVLVAGSSDKIFAINADTGSLVWQRAFPVEGAAGRKSGTLCPFALNATPVVQSGRPRTVYAISSDGKLHALSAVDGEDRFPAIPFVPAFSKNWSLNLVDGVLYTAISQRCNGVPSSVYSLDLNAPDRPVHSFEVGMGGGIWGRAGVAVSPSGAVFAETGDGAYDPETGKFADTILALSPKDLTLTDYYTPSNREWLTRKDLDMGNISPVVFRFRDREYLVGAGKEGRLYLLDTAALGGDTHRDPLFRSALLANEDVAYAGHGFWGAFASWEDPQGTRWILAPAWGAPHPAASFPVANGDASHGSIMAFRVEMKEKAPILSPAWISRDLDVPEPPIVANGVVYALSSGEDVRQADAKGNGLNTADRVRGSGKAVLFAFDAITGKELYSSGDTLASFSHFGGIALSNGRVYVTTYDGFVYAFGLQHEER